MVLEKAIFNRAELLLGADIMDIIAQKRVILFGVGGVGSWCAESLVRSGITHLTIVDSDRVCITNVNRQLMATTKTLGMVKVDVLRERLLEINPAADIIALHQIYSRDTASMFNLDDYDYVVDAIDSLQDKADLIRHATRCSCKLFSAMGAALKLDPTRIHVAEFWKVNGCPLARALRNKFKRSKDFPAKKFQCVYSDELLQNKGVGHGCDTDECYCSKYQTDSSDAINRCSNKAQINGSLCHEVAIFGLTIAGLILKDITSLKPSSE